jgi:hypothetical protein
MSDRGSVTQPLLSPVASGNAAVGHNRSSSSTTSSDGYTGELHHHPSMAGPVAPPTYQPPTAGREPALSIQQSPPTPSQPSSVAVAVNTPKLATVPAPASSSSSSSSNNTATSSSSSGNDEMKTTSSNWSGADDKTLFGKNEVIEEMTEGIHSFTLPLYTCSCNIGVRTYRNSAR